MSFDGISKFKEAFSGLDGHSFMVIQHGKILAEEYRAPYRRDSIHSLFSGTKCFIALAFGFAYDEGLLDPEDKLIDYFPEYLSNKPCEFMQELKLRHLLTMTSGHAAGDPVIVNGWDGWQEEYVRSYITERPGALFVYNSGNSNMLSAVIEKAVGQNVKDYLDRKLFAPLGINDYLWEQLCGGTYGGGYGLNLCLRDYAKVGQFMLRKGVWNGKRLLSEKWIDMMSSLQVSTAEDPWDSPDRRSGYGFQVWRCRVPGAFRADGSKGQFCIVLPGQDAVIATMAGHQSLYDILEPVWKYLLPVLEEDNADNMISVPDNKWCFANKYTEVKTDRSQELSGKEYVFADNRLKIRSVSFSFADRTLRICAGEEEGLIKIGENGEWVNNSTFPAFVGHQIGYYPVEKLYLRDIACTGAWIDSSSFALRVLYTKSTFEDEYVFSFSEKAVKLRYRRFAVDIGAASGGSGNYTEIIIYGFENGIF